jgi:hypothetical protein
MSLFSSIANIGKSLVGDVGRWVGVSDLARTLGVNDPLPNAGANIGFMGLPPKYSTPVFDLAAAAGAAYFGGSALAGSSLFGGADVGAGAAGAGDLSYLTGNPFAAYELPAATSLSGPSIASGSSIASSGFGFNPGTLLAGTSALNSLYGIYQGQQLQKMAKQQQGRQQQYADMLSGLMRDPSSLVNTPGYQAGLEAVQRGLAASGYLGSGNEMTALLNYGGNIYDQQVARLAGLAGLGAVNPSPIDIGMSGTNLTGSSLANAAYPWLIYKAMQ